MSSLSTKDQLTIFNLAHENVMTLREFLERLSLDYSLDFKGLEHLDEQALTDFVTKLTKKTDKTVDAVLDELYDSYHLENFGQEIKEYEDDTAILGDGNCLLKVDLDDELHLKSSWMAAQKNITLNQLLVDAIVAEAEAVIDLVSSTNH